MAPRIRDAADIAALRQLLAPAEPAGDDLCTIRIRSGTYVLHESLRIERSHIALVGEPGVRFVLAAGVNQPVIAIGSQAECPGEADAIFDIHLADIDVDGNQAEQSSETSLEKPWIRNNGIDVRAVRGLTIERVSASNCRSGGLVISWGCSDITVEHSVFAGNCFDGVAYYDSTRITTVGCAMRHNHAAGVSLDNAVSDSVFRRCAIEDNGDVGVFARHSRGLIFDDCTIRGSGNWGVFLAHDDEGHGVFGITLAACRLLENRGGVCMASVNETQSSATRVINSTFAGNERDGRQNIHSSGSLVASTGLFVLPEWVDGGPELVPPSFAGRPAAASGHIQAVVDQSRR